MRSDQGTLGQDASCQPIASCQQQIFFMSYLFENFTLALVSAILLKIIIRLFSLLNFVWEKNIALNHTNISGHCAFLHFVKIRA